MSEPAGLGRVEYHHFCTMLGRQPDEQLPPRARSADLPSWLSRELVVTAYARERLRHWVASGEPRVMLGDLSYCGDERVGAVVRYVLSRLPPPVVHLIVTTTLVIGVEREGGWYRSAPRLPQPTADCLRLIALNDVADVEVLQGITAHECSHLWLMPAPRPDEVLMVAEAREAHDTRLHCAAMFGQLWMERETRARYEREACALTARWGFVGPGADGAMQAEAAGRTVLREATVAVRRGVDFPNPEGIDARMTPRVGNE